MNDQRQDKNMGNINSKNSIDFQNIFGKFGIESSNHSNDFYPKEDINNDNLTNEIENEYKLPNFIFSYFNIKDKPALEKKINCIECRKLILNQQNDETLNEIVKYDICTRCYFHKNCLKLRLSNGIYLCNHNRDFRIDYRINNK